MSLAIPIGLVVIATVLEENVRVSAPTKLREVLTEDLSLIEAVWRIVTDVVCPRML
jgi:hypothetical protein